MNLSSLFVDVEEKKRVTTNAMFSHDRQLWTMGTASSFLATMFGECKLQVARNTMRYIYIG